jgi:hypothetical protein
LYVERRVVPTWLEDIDTSLRNLGGIASLEELYEEVYQVRSGPLPTSWKAIVRGTIEAHSSDSKVFRGTDIFFSVDGIGRGIWGLREQVPNTPAASDLGGSVQPKKIKTQTYRVLRDTLLARGLKTLHQNHCQICAVALPLVGGDTYAEVHHIRPLGSPHHGPDIPENILVLCPNHHVLCDYGAIELDVNKLRRHPKLAIGLEFVDYHNQIISKI